MTTGQRYNHWLAWERRRATIERKWKGKIKSALREQVQSVIGHLKFSDPYETRLNLSHIIHFEGIGIIIKALYLSAGRLQASVTYREAIRLKFTGMGQNEEWTQAIQQYFQLHLLNKAVLPITETTKDLIKKILDKAIAEGWSVEETVKAILEKTNEINEKRANVIVRTESVRAMNIGSIIGAHDSSIVLDKVWITARDERVRSSHRRLDNVKLELEDFFANGCEFPGDPNASAKETINCRCTLAFVPQRDVNGRVIRKPKMPRVNDVRTRFVAVEELINA